jgi:hypothetical protein
MKKRRAARRFTPVQRSFIGSAAFCVRENHYLNPLFDGIGVPRRVVPIDLGLITIAT